ncbi:MAG TPA: TetR/AcrR family transcriptional regulator [Polyangiaceae bacterium]
MPRPSDPQAKPRLLDAARRVFLERGLDRAKVEEITRAAGLSKGAFYLHFESKEDAFKEILSSALEELRVELGAIEASRNEQPWDDFEGIVEHWLEKDQAIYECLWKHRAIMRLVLEGGGSPDYQHLIELFAETAERMTERLVRLGIERGYYRSDVDPKVAATFCAGGYDRLARQLVRMKKKPDLKLWLIEPQSIWLHALGTPAFLEAAENVHRALLSEPKQAITA